MKTSTLAQTTLEPRSSFWQRGWARGVARVLAYGLAMGMVWPHCLWAFEVPQAALSRVGGTLAVTDITLPQTLGTITDRHQGGDACVVLIQDLHCNYEVQTRIADIIHELARTRALRLVLTEGASGRVDTAPLSAFPQARVKRGAAEYLLRQGQLTGAEWYAALGDFATTLMGIETPTLYASALETVRAFLNDESQGLIFNLRDELERVKPRVYSRELLRYDRHRVAFREGRETLLAYATAVYRGLERFGLDRGAFPELTAFLSRRAQVLPQNVPGDALMGELERAEAAIRANMEGGRDAQALGVLESRLELMEKMVNISATAAGVEQYRRNPEAYASAPFLAFFRAQGMVDEELAALESESLDAYLAKAALFYTFADQRSRVFMANALEVMRAQHAELTVLVAGGYHTEEIKAQLRARNVSYVCVEPRITQNDLLNPYYSILRRQRTPLEKFLAQTQTIMAPPLNLAAREPGFLRLLNAVFVPLTVLEAQAEGGKTLAELRAACDPIFAHYAGYDPKLALDWEHAAANREDSVYVIPSRAGGVLVVRPQGERAEPGAVERFEVGAYEALWVVAPERVTAWYAQVRAPKGTLSRAWSQIRAWMGSRPADTSTQKAQSTAKPEHTAWTPSPGTLSANIIPTLLILSAFSGNVWISLGIVGSVAVYHGVRWFYELARGLSNIGKWILLETEGLPMTGGREYSWVELSYMHQLGEAFDREMETRFGAVSAQMTPEEQIGRVRKETTVQREFAETYYRQFSAKHYEMGLGLKTLQAELFKFLESVQPGTLGFTYVVPELHEADPIPTGIKWLTKFFGTEAPMHAMLGFEPGIFLHATGRPGKRRVLPVSALSAFVHNGGEVAVMRLPVEMTPEQYAAGAGFALSQINVGFNFRRFVLGKIGRFFPGTICTDFVFTTCAAFGAKLTPKKNPLNGFSLVASVLVLGLASPLLWVLAWAGLSGLTLTLTGVAIFLAAYWNYHDVPTPYQIFKGRVDGKPLQSVFTPRKESHSSLGLLRDYFIYSHYEKSFWEYFMPTDRRSVRIVGGAVIVSFLYYLTGVVHLDLSLFAQWAEWFWRLWPGEGEDFGAGLYQLAALQFWADPSLAGQAQSTLGVSVLGVAFPRTAEKSIPTVVLGQPGNERTGTPIRNQGRWLQRTAQAWLAGILFHSDATQAGRYAGLLRLDGVVTLFTSAFFLLQGITLGWLLLGGKRGERLKHDEPWKKILQLQTAEQTAFDIFAKYGQGGFGELAPRSELSGSVWVRWQSWLGWAHLGANGRMVYYIPDALLEEQASPWRRLVLRLILENQIRRMANQTRPDLELERAQSFSAGVWTRVQHAWWMRSGSETAVRRLLAQDRSPLAQGLKQGTTPLGRAFHAWLKSPAASPEWLQELAEVLSTGSREEQQASWATLATLCENVPGLVGRRIGQGGVAAGSLAGRMLWLPRWMDRAPWGSVRRSVLEKLERLPGIVPERRRGIPLDDRNRGLDQAA